MTIMDMYMLQIALQVLQVLHVHVLFLYDVIE